MAFSRNKIELVGNLGGDAEQRFTPSGKAVTSFSLGVSRQWKQDGQDMKETSWFKVSCWDTLAEQAGHLLKGQQVLVIGYLKPDPTTGSPRLWAKQDGTQGASYDVTASEIWLSLYKSTGARASQPAGAQENSDFPSDQDIPF